MGKSTGRPRAFSSPEEMEKKWEEFKAYCDNKYVTKHEFSQRQGTFVSAELKHADVREKFETGEIPPQLSALWMSKFGYGTNNNVTVDAKELVDDWIDGVMSHGDKG
ncbi:MAG: DNA-packaging protein [Ruminococcus sp.]|nr:DNA-packaging protein [Ruminococcus sp.]